MRTIIFLALMTGTASANPVATFKAVCDSPAIKSEALSAACATNQPPPVLKDGSRFHARGIGAEVNTLFTNLRFFVDKPIKPQ